MWLPTANLEDLVFLDESGVHTAMTRMRGRALKGQPVRELIPRNRGRVTTLLGAMTFTRVVTVMAIESGTDKDVFLAFCKEDLIPCLKPGQIVVLDNLGAHRAADVIELFRQHNIGLKFLPPYSPELNPIELLWHWLKDRIRTVRPRDTSTLDAAIHKALKELPPEHLEAWCRNCGYKRL